MEKLIDTSFLSKLIEIHKEQEKTNEYLLTLILQMIEMNQINRDILQISGGAPNSSKKLVDKEIEFLKTHVEAYCGEAKKIVKIASLIYKENKEV